MALCKSNQRRQDGVQIRFDQGESVSHLQDEASVGDVLRRRASMDMPAQFDRQRRLQSRNKRNDRHARQRRLLPKRRQIEILRFERRYCRPKLRRDDAVFCFGARQGLFRAKIPIQAAHDPKTPHASIP